MTKQYIMLNSETFKTDGIVVSSSICQSTPISIGCASSLIFVF